MNEGNAIPFPDMLQEKFSETTGQTIEKHLKPDNGPHEEMLLEVLLDEREDSL
jgi:hypothetical protein